MIVDKLALSSRRMRGVGSGNARIAVCDEGHDSAPVLLLQRVWINRAGAERVRSDLQDFVAESSFGWGQLRP